VKASMEVNSFLKKALIFSEIDLYKQLIVAVFSVIIIIAAGDFLVLNPKLYNLKLLKQEETSLSYKVKQNNLTLATLPLYKLQLQQLNRQNNLNSKFLASYSEIPQIENILSSLGEKSGLEFKLFMPKDEIVGKFYAKLPIEIIALGNYQQFRKFVFRVSKYKKIILLSNIFIKPHSISELSVNSSFLDEVLEFKFTAFIYFSQD